MTQYASINPNSIPGANEPNTSNEFAALVQVKSSRFVKYEYAPESGLAPKIGIKWEMGTTKGNTFDRVWSIGQPWDGNEGAISPDGKSCTLDIKRNSDAYYLLQKVLETEFPAAKLTNDISVFEGETFFMTTDANPRARGSRRKVYPKRYHPEGWEAAREAALQRQAAKAAQQNAPAYTPQSSYNPPVVVQTASGDVMQTAAEALASILSTTGGKVDRKDIPKQLNTFVETNKKTWDPNFRREVGIALWDINQLTTVVASNPAWTLNGETISFRG